MPAITRAISIRQPWVELILRGEKTEEFRSQPTRIKERVYLYASLRPAEYSAKHWKKLGLEPGDLPTGLIVGSVEIEGCRGTADGYYAYKLGNPKRLRKPIKAMNQPQPRFWIPQF